MLCVRCDGDKLIYTEEDVVDVGWGMILVRNIALGISSMGTGDLCMAIKRSFITAVGRVIEAPSGGGRDLVGRSIFYRPRVGNDTLCLFSPGDPGESVEISVEDSGGADGIIAMEAELAIKYSRVSGPSPLVIGGGFEAYIAIQALNLAGVRAATIGRVFRGVEVNSLSLDTASSRGFSSVYLAGIASEEEKRILGILASRGGIDIYYHPLLAGEVISIPLGDRVRIRSLRYSRPRVKAVELSRRVMRAARGYKYLEVRIDEEPPLSTDLLIISLSERGSNRA